VFFFTHRLSHHYSQTELIVQTSNFGEPQSALQNGDGASRARSQASQIGQRAAAAIDEKLASVARDMDSAASTLHDQAETLPGGERVVNAAHTTADAMEAAAEFVRDHDVETMIDDARQLVRRRPGATLLVAAALGFVLARAFSRHR
jgi:hypothetical protein